ncbi:anti-adapter protein IraP [Superficieibacter electus]|uniref:Anti-adapter protein IraP n=1 Tax=Superficieibacter electus TaxID=2022662 RepID=A0A2P5GU34_9ENTR|nr:anti-adapter protein IraP [Superficieibacter electus]POP47226.1 anti-adapter protein IraP [Superficieibacter electus]POP50072.1 anti-adapter protein IraP [Superficieibacter electus]
MTNIILGMIAKISRMDAETKQLTARIEAQSLLLGAFLLATGKEGGALEMVEAVKKAINAAVELAESPLKSDAEILLNEFNEILSMAQLLTRVEAELDIDAIKAVTSNDENKE